MMPNYYATSYQINGGSGAKIPPGWVEYADEKGVPYYYNTSTGVSTYNVPTSGNPRAASSWEEYKDSNSGKTYYFNKVTKQCVWEEPEELRVQKAREEAKQLGFRIDQRGKMVSNLKKSKLPKVNVESTPLAGKEEGKEPSDQLKNVDTSISSESSVPEKSSLGVEKAQEIKEAESEEEDDDEDDEENFDHLSKKEAIAMFKQMLLDKKISSRIKWQEAMKRIVLETRWNCLKTLGERKQAFAEYQTQRSKEEKLEARKRAKAAREEFMKMLAACEKITAKTRWNEAEELLKNDQRFQAVQDSHERRDLLLDFVRELERSERADERAQREQARTDTLNIFRDKYKDQITASSRLQDRTLRDLLFADEKLASLPRNDLYQWFDDYVFELRKMETDKRRKERDSQKEKERKFEVDVREYLKNQFADGKIKWNQRWKDFKVENLESSSIFKAMEEGKFEFVVRNVFEEITNNMRREFRNVEEDLMDLFQEKDFSITLDTTFEEVIEFIKAAEKGQKLIDRHENMLLAVYEDRHGYELKRAKEKAAQLRKRKESFEELLTEYYYRSDHVGITWDFAERQLRSRSAFQRLPEDCREDVFKQYMSKLAEMNQACLKSRSKLEKKEEKSKKSNRKRSTRSKSSSSSSRSRSRSRSRSVSSHSDSSHDYRRSRSSRKHRSKKSHGRGRKRQSRSRSSSSSRSRSRSYSRSYSKSRSRSRSDSESPAESENSKSSRSPIKSRRKKSSRKSSRSSTDKKRKKKKSHRKEKKSKTRSNGKRENDSSADDYEVKAGKPRDSSSHKRYRKSSNLSMERSSSKKQSLLKRYKRSSNDKDKEEGEASEEEEEGQV